MMNAAVAALAPKRLDNLKGNDGTYEINKCIHLNTHSPYHLDMKL